ncbi:unnamed protein product [Allacma fusca]|uniref:Uncharacterized protein n=1 Tax=Allacma fusca TaxID=39272 RepID=A0A8J2NX01_9HEXA|nr:unnamed protein product [Allacma fusca]
MVRRVEKIQGTKPDDQESLHLCVFELGTGILKRTMTLKKDYLFRMLRRTDDMMKTKGVIRRKYIPSKHTEAHFDHIRDAGPPRLERKIIIMSIINIISFVVTLKQLYIDVSWNMRVRIRDPDLLFSCSVQNNNFLLQESQCCKRNVKTGVTKLFTSNQLSERHVLCFIIIAGLSAFILLFIIGGFCVGCRSKHRNILMHPIFSVGTFTHLTNCFLFVLGFLLRQKDPSIICNDTDQAKVRQNKVLDCLKQILPCEDMDANFKYWFFFSMSWVLLGIVLLLVFHRHSKQFLHGIFTCSPHMQHASVVYPVPSVDETVVPIIQ